MKATVNICILFWATQLLAQTAMYNNGNLRIHNGAQMGLHTSLINNGPLDANGGLVGFYGGQQSVSGTAVPLFHDLEIALNTQLKLDQGIDVRNNVNFISGNIATDRTMANAYITFVDDGFYVGETDLAKVNGYAAVVNKSGFIFPVGSATTLRPLVFRAESMVPFAKCAYFLEDPNAPVSIPGTYDTTNIDRDLGAISNVEFWQLESSIPVTITLNWDPNSAMANLTDDYNFIVPVGWSKADNEWVTLGATSRTGTLEEGFVSSEPFLANNYEIIALGVTRDALKPIISDLIELDNFYVSPNGDGINDTWIVPQLQESPNNIVRIFDRYGLKVFEKENYTNGFSGVANTEGVLMARQEGLPAGVYFYTIYMADLDLNYQGFLYLAR